MSYIDLSETNDIYEKPDHQKIAWSLLDNQLVINPSYQSQIGIELLFGPTL